MVSVAFFCTYMCLITDMITLPHPSYYRGLGQFVILEERLKGRVISLQRGEGVVGKRQSSDFRSFEVGISG